jgi:hypothetical protein
MSISHRPSPGLIRAWFLLLGVTVIACLVVLFDFTIQPVITPGTDGDQPVYSSWLR